MDGESNSVCMGRRGVPLSKKEQERNNVTTNAALNNSNNNMSRQRNNYHDRRSSNAANHTYVSLASQISGNSQSSLSRAEKRRKEQFDRSLQREVQKIEEVISHK